MLINAFEAFNISQDDLHRIKVAGPFIDQCDELLSETLFYIIVYINPETAEPCDILHPQKQ